MTCSVEGCNKAVHCRTYCVAHYQRFRKHGSPLAGGPPHAPKGDAMLMIELALRSGRENCFFWPYAKNGAGYGQIAIQGKKALAHRYVCEQAHGSPPTPSHQAAHSCGKGHLGCINPHHLSWKTPLENAADQETHGTRIQGERVGTSKITAGIAADVWLRAQRGEPQQDIADRYGLDQSTISNIKTGKSWGWLNAE